MSGMELNKVMAAVLVAGIVASFSGFISKETIHAHELHENAVKIEGVSDAHINAAAAAPEEPQYNIIDMVAGADIARGKKVSRACAACHSFGKGEGNRVGPNLWNIVNGKTAAKSDYKYSNALKDHGGTWDYEALDKFLLKPKKYISGTKMSYAGLKKVEDRAALIAWLKTMSDN